MKRIDHIMENYLDKVRENLLNCACPGNFVDGLPESENCKPDSANVASDDECIKCWNEPIGKEEPHA